MDVSHAAIGAGMKGLQMCDASVDFQDGFYQFRYLLMCAWFGIDCEMTAAEAGVERVVVTSSGRAEWAPVDPQEWVYPCFCGMAMGWSWALFLCHAFGTHRWVPRGHVALLEDRHRAGEGSAPSRSATVSAAGEGALCPSTLRGQRQLAVLRRGGRS